MPKSMADGPETDRALEPGVVRLAARAHDEAARLAETHGHLRSARDYRAFSKRVRAALREFESGPRARV
jgi:hypothetical protein